MLLKKLIGEILADMGFVTKRHLDGALKKQRNMYNEKVLPERLQRSRLISEARLATNTTPALGQILVDMGVTTQDQLDQAIRKQENLTETYKSVGSERLGAVVEKCTVINSTLNIAEVLDTIMKYANHVTNSAASTLMLLDEETGELVFSIPTGPKSDKLTDIRIPAGEGIAGSVVASEQHLLIPDVSKDPRFYGKVDEKSGYETKSILCVPLMAKTKLIGVLEVINKTDGNSFTEEDAMLLNFFASQAAVAIENARFYGELKRKYEEEKEIQEKFVESEKLRALGLMTTGIAHDFNNRLAIITGNIDLIEIEEDKDKILKKVQIIKKTARDSAKTIRRLQKYARTKSDELELQAIKLNDLVREAIELSTPMWKDGVHAKGINVDIVNTLTEDGSIILGDDTDLREAIINMIFNSVDAMPQGGEIHIATYTKNESVFLDLSDNGTGMNEETKNRIFDPFFTMKGLDHSGLGMSMMYGTIKRHNGSIDIKTELGKGTTFTIAFPKGKEKIERRRDRVQGSVVEIKKANILVIDDESEIGVVLSEILSKQGHQISVFDSGEGAIKAFKEGGYELLITGLGLPDISGWELINTVRQIEPDVVTGVITGWDVSEEEAKQKGVDFLVNKPFEANQIAQAVANAVKHKQVNK
ncbi:MAG: GAF domain-containing protein [Candidatus Scalindua sp.]|nr:GAF domain-containing protein [Candidatus Scalindua sp.]